MNTLHNTIRILGHLHPLLVHLPIGGLLLAAALELAAKHPQYKKAAQTNRLILGFVAVFSVLSAGAGWLLSSSGRYDGQLLHWHMWAGATVALGCAVTFLLNVRSRMTAYRLCLCSTLAALVLAAHLGGSMTYGRGFLTRRVTARSYPQYRATAARVSLTSVNPFYHTFVQPVFQEHCVSCHGPEKQEADLRLDTVEALQRGGDQRACAGPGESSQQPARAAPACSRVRRQPHAAGWQSFIVPPGNGFGAVVDRPGTAPGPGGPTQSGGLDTVLMTY